MCESQQQFTPFVDKMEFRGEPTFTVVNLDNVNYYWIDVG